jgi:hypothetical protein
MGLADEIGRIRSVVSTTTLKVVSVATMRRRLNDRCGERRGRRYSRSENFHRSVLKRSEIDRCVLADDNVSRRVAERARGARRRLLSVLDAKFCQPQHGLSPRTIGQLRPTAG